MMESQTATEAGAQVEARMQSQPAQSMHDDAQVANNESNKNEDEKQKSNKQDAAAASTAQSQSQSDAITATANLNMNSSNEAAQPHATDGAVTFAAIDNESRPTHGTDFSSAVVQPSSSASDTVAVVNSSAVAASSANSTPATTDPAHTPSAPSVPTQSSLQLIDWKLAEEKGGTPYVTFLFEVCYVYNEAERRAMRRMLKEAGETSIPVSALPTHVSHVTAKRFAELHSFHTLLERHFVCLPPFPSRTLGRRFDKLFIEQRCMALQVYLSQVLLRKDVERTGWLPRFFGVPSPAAQARKARASMNESRRQADWEKEQHARKIAAREQRRAQHHDSAILASEPPSATGSLFNDQASHLSASLNDDSASVFETQTAPHAVPPTTAASDGVMVEVGDGSMVGVDDASIAEYDDDDDDTSEPATTSDSFTVPTGSSIDDVYTSAAARAAEAVAAEQHDQQVGGAESDDEFEAALAKADQESDAERKRRKEVGSQVHEQRRGDKSHTNVEEWGGDDTYPSTVPSSSSASSTFLPSRVILEFISRSSVFSMRRLLATDPLTLLCAAADTSPTTRVDSWFSNLLGGKGKKKQPEESTTFTSSSSPATHLSNPQGALYAFRRASADPSHSTAAAGGDLSSHASATDFAQSLHVFFPAPLTGLEWDASRRWIFVTDASGMLHLYNPSSDWDFVIKILSLPIFDSKPITHVKLAPCMFNGSGGLIAASATGSGWMGTRKQEVTVFDVGAQMIVPDASFVFNTKANTEQDLLDMEIDNVSSRLILSSHRSAITLYDLQPLDLSTPPSHLRATPPPLLHRLCGGHTGEVKCLVFSAEAGLLASGGVDGLVLLWSLGAKHTERLTELLVSMDAHLAPVTCMTFSPDGRFLASADEEGYVVIWHPRRRAALMAFRAHANAVRNVQLTQQAMLLTASDDKTCKLWQLA